MPKLHVLKVFVGEGGVGGNPLGVFLEGEEIPEPERQGVAADLGFSETVFVEDAASGEVRIFTPGTELPFAGHPLVGTAWLLNAVRGAVTRLQPPAGEVPVRFDGDSTFIDGRPEWAPPFEHVELSSPGEVEALSGPPEGHDLVGAWAWEDKEAGRVRVRVFPQRCGWRLCWGVRSRYTKAKVPSYWPRRNPTEAWRSGDEPNSSKPATTKEPAGRSTR